MLPFPEEATCSHGVAWDVHCCGCHSGFLFDAMACTCLNGESMEPLPVVSADPNSPDAVDLDVAPVLDPAAEPVFQFP